MSQTFNNTMTERKCGGWGREGGFIHISPASPMITRFSAYPSILCSSVPQTLWDALSWGLRAARQVYSLSGSKPRVRHRWHSWSETRFWAGKQRCMLTLPFSARH